MVKSNAIEDLEAFLRSQGGREALNSGRLVASRMLDPAEAGMIPLPLLEPGSRIVEHPRIPFPSYPTEWSPLQLMAAGRLTLDLASALLPDGFGLKDASAYNVLFQGTEPVFVDVLSVERRLPGDPLWLPRAQFHRHFLLPLLVNRALGLGPAHVFATRRDGLEPEDCYRFLSWSRRLFPPFLTTVTLPTWLTPVAERRASRDQGQRPLRDPAQVLFVLQWQFRQLSRLLERARPPKGDSRWQRYVSTHTYSSRALEAKERVVREVLDRYRPEWLLDVGCNTGVYTHAAARYGAKVVAIDSDPTVVDHLWENARRNAPSSILPLVVDLARPTPPLGWRNAESLSFLERAKGRFDGALLLAVLHHLVVTHGIPVAEVIGLVAEMVRTFAVIEFVPPSDGMFQTLARGRDKLYRDFTPEAFLSSCREHFRIVQHHPLPDSERSIAVLERIDASTPRRP